MSWWTCSWNYIESKDRACRDNPAYLCNTWNYLKVMTSHLEGRGYTRTVFFRDHFDDRFFAKSFRNYCTRYAYIWQDNDTDDRTSSKLFCKMWSKTTKTNEVEESVRQCARHARYLLTESYFDFFLNFLNKYKYSSVDVLVPSNV